MLLLYTYSLKAVLKAEQEGKAGQQVSAMSLHIPDKTSWHISQKAALALSWMVATHTAVLWDNCQGGLVLRNEHLRLYAWNNARQRKPFGYSFCHLDSISENSRGFPEGPKFGIKKDIWVSVAFLFGQSGGCVTFSVVLEIYFLFG